MMKAGGSYFLHVAEMDVKTASSAMEALARISVSILRFYLDLSRDVHRKSVLFKC